MDTALHTPSDGHAMLSAHIACSYCTAETRLRIGGMPIQSTFSTNRVLNAQRAHTHTRKSTMMLDGYPVHLPMHLCALASGGCCKLFHGFASAGQVYYFAL